jgi:hypothetical protein
MREPLTLAFHPNGNQLVIGFQEGFQLYFVLQEDFFLAYESYEKNCNCLKYS